MINCEEQTIGTAALSEQIKRVEAVAPRQQQQHDSAERAEVAPHVRGRSHAATVHPQTSRQRVQHDDQRGHRHHAHQGPQIQRLFDRQPVEIEAEIAAEYTFNFPERQPVPDEREIHPVRERNRQHTADQHCQHHRDGQEALPRNHRDQLEVGHARRHGHRFDGAANRIEIGEGEETTEGPGATLQDRRVDDLLPEERGHAHGREPRVINEQRRCRAPQEEQRGSESQTEDQCSACAHVSDPYARSE